jgi:hypothetical protein
MSTKRSGRSKPGDDDSSQPTGLSGQTLPVRPLINPLSSEDEAVLESVMAKSAVVHDLTERMKACGIDVSQHQDRNSMHHHVASTMKQLFFPATLQIPPNDPE